MVALYWMTPWVANRLRPCPQRGCHFAAKKWPPPLSMWERGAYFYRTKGPYVITTVLRVEWKKMPANPYCIRPQRTKIPGNRIGEDPDCGEGGRSCGVTNKGLTRHLNMFSFHAKFLSLSLSAPRTEFKYHSLFFIWNCALTLDPQVRSCEYPNRRVRSRLIRINGEEM